MRNTLFFFAVALLAGPASFSQPESNRTLSGVVLYMNSNNRPAAGVQVAGTAQRGERANPVYTSAGGAFDLIFVEAEEGHWVNLEVGDSDEKGTEIEVVNQKEINRCYIPKLSGENKPFKVIVCPKGYRDLAAQKYYGIIKTSADSALAKKEKEFNALLKARQKDYKKIEELSAELSRLQQENDSIRIYRDAFEIASINKDNASKRTLRFIQLLDEGKSIQEAREALSIRLAAIELGASISQFDAAVKELDIRAGASMSIFDYEDAISCYDTIIYYMERVKINPMELAEYYLKAVEGLHDGGKYELALEYNQKAIDIWGENLGPKHLDLANSYNSIAFTYQLLGQYEKALEYHQKSIGIREANLDPMHPDLANSYNSIGTVYQDLGQYETALEYHQKSIGIQESNLGPKHPDLANSYNSIGTVYHGLGQYERALEYYQKAIGIREEVLGLEHPHLAISFNNIMLTYNALGRYEKTLEYHQKAIGILEEILDPKHPYLATLYDNIGINYYFLGQYEKALEYHQKAIGIREEVLGPKHPHLAFSYNSIAVAYGALRQYEKALEYHQKTIGIREKFLDPQHPSLAVSYNNVGVIHKILGQYEKALEFYQKAIVTIQQS